MFQITQDLFIWTWNHCQRKRTRGSLPWSVLSGRRLQALGAWPGYGPAMEYNSDNRAARAAALKLPVPGTDASWQRSSWLQREEAATYAAAASSEAVEFTEASRLQQHYALCQHATRDCVGSSAIRRVIGLHEGKEEEEDQTVGWTNPVSMQRLPGGR